jgi:predicted AlkP superfamily pyrophosphatase or phosphodiesterase
MTALRKARSSARHSVVLGLLSCSLLLWGGCAATQAPSEPASERAGDPAPLILISFDGFRWDYPERYDTPHLDRMAQVGVRARYLEPAFPTKTFPNHYTIVTGLYPAHHGIISNNMYDPVFDASFSLANTKAVQGARWWGGEPIWVTAETQGLTAATFFWPGSEAPVKGVRPSYWRAYDGSIPPTERVNQVLRWLDLPGDERADFITLYFSAADDAGHAEGPTSDAVAAAVKALDERLGQLYDGLAVRGLTDEVNVLVTSDHGMIQVSPERVIFLDDYLTGTDGRPGLDDLRVTERSPVFTAWPDSGKTQAVLDALRGAHPALDVYHRSEMPDSLRFSGHRRIPPVIAIASPGWSLITHDAFDTAEDLNVRFSGGVHGYVPSDPRMRGVFYARGPAFPAGERAGPIHAVDLYGLMTRLLDLDAAPNDGDPETARKLLKDPDAP